MNSQNRNKLKSLISEIISRIIHPLIIPPIAFTLLTFSEKDYNIISLISLCIVICTISIIPFLYISRMKYQGEIENIDIPNRQKREKPFIKGTILFFSSVVLLFYLDSPRQIIALMSRFYIAATS